MEMSCYTKLFHSILHSTIWTEPNHVRIAWITMLAMTNKFGEVNASVPGLAKAAGITLEETEDALQRFLSPDKYSRTPDNEGRRIEVMEGGWRLLNHPKYRELMSTDERREYFRIKQAERRARLSKNCQKSSNTVKRSQTQSTLSTHTDADSNTNPFDEEERRSPSPPKFPELDKFAKSQPMPIPEDCIEAFFDEMESLQWTYKGMPCVATSAWQARFRKWTTNWINNQRKAK